MDLATPSTTSLDLGLNSPDLGFHLLHLAKLKPSVPHRFSVKQRLSNLCLDKFTRPPLCHTSTQNFQTLGATAKWMDSVGNARVHPVDLDIHQTRISLATLGETQTLGAKAVDDSA
jgi:hypothetical protein